MDIEKRMLSISEIMDNSEIELCYAHVSDEKRKKETLKEHTERSQKYWKKIVYKKRLDIVIDNFEKLYFTDMSKEAIALFEKMTVNIVTMHDLGKLNPRFQKDKMGYLWHTELFPDNNIGSKHSILSSVFYLDYFITEINKCLEKTEKEILKDFAYIYSYIISRHHGSLSELEKYLHSLSGDELSGENLGNRAKEWLWCWKKEIMGTEEVVKIRKRWNSMTGRLENSKSVYLYGLTRLLYSLLTAADYYATSEFMSGVEVKEFGEITRCQQLVRAYESGQVQQMIRNYQKETYPMEREAFDKVGDINILRTEMFLDAECELKKNMDKHLFYLEAPTGSGKSNTAMNLSFTLMNSNEYIQKIFYIYPFNTLVEQNMASLDKVFEGKKDILSQIAVVNSLVPIKERNEEWNNQNENQKYQEILLDRQFLNYPIVLSTHVMLFRTLFGKSKEDAFGFHQVCHSVIVLDEIQSYRSDRWSEMITFLKALAELMNIKIIIMSATLPNLEVLTDNRAKTVKLLKERKKYFNHDKFAKRVVPNYELLDTEITLESLLNIILENNKSDKKILIEFIKKKSAEEFYYLLKREYDGPVYLMTGDSSIQDRKRLIDKIEDMKSVILVATQVIEAGVDIDMDIGYKDISRLDSEEQFMGRINRSGKNKGIVYFFDLDGAAAIYKNDVRSEVEFTLLNDEIKDILTSKNFPDFYEEKILPIMKRKGEMLNEDNLMQFFKKDVGRLNMPAISERMKLIEDNRQMISVYLGRNILNQRGEQIDGKILWERYKELLQDNEMEYAQKTVRLRNIRSEMNGFIYQLSNRVKFQEDEQIGDLYYIENGEEYFDENGILRKELFDENTDLFL